MFQGHIQEQIQGKRLLKCSCQMLAPTSCRNPSLGLVTKAKVYKDAGQEKCERM
jgi:hypothetical protein